MTTNFPSSIDAFTNPTSADTLDNPPHDQQHADINDAMEAVQAKVGVDGSTVTSSLDYKVANFTNKLGSGSAAKVPGSFVGGDVLQAAELNAGLPSCLLESTSQTVPNATFTSLTFSTESYDPLGWHSTSSNPERITPNIAGVYLVSAGTSDISFGVAGRVFIGINKNAAVQAGRYDTTATLIYGASTNVVVTMNGTTDFLYVNVYQTSGGNKDFQVNHFSVTRIAG